MILEVCIDSYEGALLAQKYNAKRVELCAALSVGGLSPSKALVEKCGTVEGVEVHAMLRLREGDFCYSNTEIEQMQKELIELANANAKGVVLGCLTVHHQIDSPSCKLLVDQAKELGLEVTFHRAFDFVENPKEALEELIALGFDRLLTSGKEQTAAEGIHLIQQLVQQADGRIEIMAGSGVNASNALRLSAAGVDALHFTSHQLDGSTRTLGMGSKSIPDEQKIASLSTLFQ